MEVVVSRSCRTMILLALLLTLDVGAADAQTRTLHFLAPGFPAELVSLLEKEILPEFEELYDVDVTIEPVDWGARTDRIAILVASGLPPDLVGTGYYSPYQEGASGLLAPLDKYIGEWEHTRAIPDPVWETQRWQGQVMAVPLWFDLRAIAYNQALFAEAGLDPNRPPQSWEELLEAIHLLTRFNASGDAVEVRGITFWGAAQEMLTWIHQTGVQPVVLEEFRSYLNTPQAIEAARFFVEMIRTSRPEFPLAGGGFENGAIAMTTTSPANVRTWFENMGESFLSQMGLFAPRRSPGENPVAVGFINGIGITSASPNKDLAWKLIEYLMSDDVLIQIQQATGWMTPRTDLAGEFDAPYLDLYYPLVTHIKAAQLPPPRNQSQDGLDAIMNRAINNEISPEQAMLEGHELWQRLLNEWKAELGK